MISKSIQSSRPSISIVNQIKEAIFQKKLMPGDKLPSERVLMEQFGASWVTVREALRTLEHSDMSEIRREAEGDVFISDPNSKFVSNFLKTCFPWVRLPLRI